jgi:putative endonuclease
MELGAYVYIITNFTNTVLYIGHTVNLNNRLYEHVNKIYPKSFTARYNCNKVVFYEFYPSIMEAVKKEYQLKAWKRQWKIELIEKTNPDWLSLNKNIEEL